MARKGDVAVCGRGALARELVEASQRAGYAAVMVDDVGRFRREIPRAAIVVEAWDSDEYHRREVLDALGHALRRDAILLADALPATARECASWAGQPGRCVGYGVVGRLAEQKVVEIARFSQTIEAAVEKARAFFGKLGVETRVIGDRPGLISGRTIAALANEAAWAVTNGVALPEDVDRAMELGTNYPRGPLAWARAIGIERIVAILENIRRHEGEAYAPAPLLLDLATHGKETMIG